MSEVFTLNYILCFISFIEFFSPQEYDFTLLDFRENLKFGHKGSTDIKES